MIKLAEGLGGSFTLAGIWIWFRLKVWPKIQEIWQILELVIPVIEQAAKDGKITKAERKSIAWAAVNEYCKAKNIKLGILPKIIINVVIDKIAGKLPDFNIPDAEVLATELVDKAIKEKNGKA